MKQGYFAARFAVLFNGLKNINEVILDTSCWGTTQQKRESLNLDYDQFIFCDTGGFSDPVVLSLSKKDIQKALDGFEVRGWKYEGLYTLINEIKWCAEQEIFKTLKKRRASLVACQLSENFF